MPQSSIKAHPAVTVTNLLEESDLSKIPATALFVPTGEHFLEWHHKNDSQSKFAGGGESLQSNVILASWLSVNNITQLIPSTLIPIGVLILLYNMFVAANPEASKNQQTGGGGHDLAGPPSGARMENRSQVRGNDHFTGRSGTFRFGSRSRRLESNTECQAFNRRLNTMTEQLTDGLSLIDFCTLVSKSSSNEES